MISTISDARKQLFEILKRDAFFKERVVLSSGKVSDYYLDARRVTLQPKGAFLSAMLILDITRGLKFDAVGGPTLGADPLVGAIGVVSFQANNPVNTFIIRKAPKPHGRQQQIEGPLIPEGGNVILIDDVATTGKAFIESIAVLKGIGIKASKCVCLIDREEGAGKAVQEAGSELVSIFTAREFLQ